MTKLLVILLLIIGGTLIALNYVSKKFKSFLENIVSPGKMNSSKKSTKEDEVLYKKDDIVILRGEADNKSDDETTQQN